MTGRLRAAALLALASFAAACSDQLIGGPVEGTLESPNAEEGAAVLELGAVGLGPIAVRGGEAYTNESGNVTRVVIVLRSSGPIRFGVTLPDGVAAPSVRVIEVAGPNNEIRTSLGRYSVSYRRPEQ